MTSHDSLSHLEPDDVASNHNSDALNQISDDVDERSPHVDVLIALSCPGEKLGRGRREEKEEKKRRVREATGERKAVEEREESRERI